MRSIVLIDKYPLLSYLRRQVSIFFKRMDSRLRGNDTAKLVRSVCLLSLLLVALVLSACGLLDNGAEPTAEAIAVETATPIAHADAVPQSTPDILIDAPISVTQQVLTVWLPPELSMRAEGGAIVFSEQLLAFNAQHPDLEIRVEQKSVGGEGGILSYLRNGRNTAPSILPHLVALPVENLQSAAGEGLIYPLNDLIAAETIADLYPLAQEMAQLDEQTIGYPFALTNMPHMVYNTAVVSDTVPTTWEGMTAVADAQFIFPAAGKEGALLLLELYLAAGGTVADEEGQPTLQAEPLEAALTLLRDARVSQTIAIQSGDAANLDQSYQSLSDGAANIAQTSADQYLKKQIQDQAFNFAPLPGITRPLTPLADGWAWAISAPNPEQRALAAELLTALTANDALGEWSYASVMLPARRNALAAWTDYNTPYIQFLDQELERAAPAPVAANSAIMIALGDAVFNVVSMTQTPNEAAGNAVTAVNG